MEHDNSVTGNIGNTAGGSQVYAPVNPSGGEGEGQGTGLGVECPSDQGSGVSDGTSDLPLRSQFCDAPLGHNLGHNCEALYLTRAPLA